MSQTNITVTGCELDINPKSFATFSKRQSRFGRFHAAATSFIKNAKGAKGGNDFVDTVAGRCAWVESNWDQVAEGIRALRTVPEPEAESKASKPKKKASTKSEG